MFADVDYYAVAFDLRHLLPYFRRSMMPFRYFMLCAAAMMPPFRRYLSAIRHFTPRRYCMAILRC